MDLLTDRSRASTGCWKGWGSTADFKAHAAMVLIGTAEERMDAFYGFLPPEQIVEKVDELSAARRAKP
jgi:hypothetical protein